MKDSCNLIGSINEVINNVFETMIPIITYLNIPSIIVSTTLTYLTALQITLWYWKNLAIPWQSLPHPTKSKNQIIPFFTGYQQAQCLDFSFENFLNVYF